MLTNQQVTKRLRDEFNDIESKLMWNVTFRVSYNITYYNMHVHSTIINHFINYGLIIGVGIFIIVY